MSCGNVKEAFMSCLNCRLSSSWCGFPLDTSTKIIAVIDMVMSVIWIISSIFIAHGIAEMLINIVFYMVALALAYLLYDRGVKKSNPAYVKIWLGYKMVWLFFLSLEFLLSFFLKEYATQAGGVIGKIFGYIFILVLYWYFIAVVTAYYKEITNQQITPKPVSTIVV